MGVITDRDMQASATGADQWLTEDAPRGAGRFIGRISKTGDQRGFYFRYTDSQGQRDTLPLGNYHPKGSDGLTVAQARAQAGALSKLYQSGIKDIRQHLAQLEADRLQAQESERQRIADEQHQREEAKKAAALADERRVTVRRLFEQWRTADLQPRLRADGKRAGRVDGGQYVLDQFKRHVFPSLGETSIEDVRKADLLALLDAQKSAGKMRTANVLLADLKQMFDFALERELIPGNPLATVKKKKVGGPSVERDRTLDDKELKALPKALAASGMHARSVAAIWLILATGVRVGELMGAVWATALPTNPTARMRAADELATVAEADGVKLGFIDIERRTWHLPTTKNQRSHTIHLSAFALKQLETLAQYREEIKGTTTKELSPWLFPANDNTRPVCVKSFGKQLSDRQREPKRRMKNRARATTALQMPGGKWTAHDLRRTAATIMARLGFGSDTINECLNHIQSDKMARVYIQDRREADQARAFDALGARLEELKAGSAMASNVVPMHAAA